jgi:hypothetical protein
MSEVRWLKIGSEHVDWKPDRDGRQNAPGYNLSMKQTFRVGLFVLV